jgi:Tetratricopeptide repeat
MWSQSHTLKQQGRDSDALAMLEACVQLQNQKLGSNHPYTISATATLKKWRTPVHHPPPHSPSGNSNGRHEIHQSERSTQARHSQSPGINHRGNQLIVERSQPLDQLQRPRKRKFYYSAENN